MLHTDEIRKSKIAVSQQTYIAKRKAGAPGIAPKRAPRNLDQTKAGIAARLERGVQQRAAREAKKKAMAKEADSSVTSSSIASDSATQPATRTATRTPTRRATVARKEIDESSLSSHPSTPIDVTSPPATHDRHTRNTRMGRSCGERVMNTTDAIDPLPHANCSSPSLSLIHI